LAKKSSVLTVHDVAVSYGYIQAVKKADLEVDQGEFIVLLGSNGAGKSSLLNALIGKAPANRGRITFMGKDITRWRTENIVRSGIAIVPEGRGILPLMSVMENLLLGAYYVKNKNDVSESLKLIFKLFPILEKRKNQQAGTFSGGEQQMLAIGRALMSSPKLLIMDEPSLGLAPIIIGQIYEVISDLHKKGQTLLIAEQNIQKALKYADRGYVIDLGTTVLNGTCQLLASNESVQKAYLGASDSLCEEKP
jgi:branched-chain amino acid transport system ATP-binding protein